MERLILTEREQITVIRVKGTHYVHGIKRGQKAEVLCRRVAVEFGRKKKYLLKHWEIGITEWLPKRININYKL